MPRSRKPLKILPLPSAASVVAFAVATAQGGPTLTLFYGQDTSASNSNNWVGVGTTFNRNGAGSTAQPGERQYLTGVTLDTTINPSAATNTITLPVGDYLSLALDAVLTGDVNPDAGDTGGGIQPPQPSYLGLAVLSVGISSTDSTASHLTPIALSSTPLQLGGNGISTTYSGFAKINGNTAGTGPFAQGNNGGGGVAPSWPGLAGTADVQPNLPGFDQGAGNGNVGIAGYTTGVGALPPLGGQSINDLSQFASQINTANYANATDFEDSIMFQGLAAGTVTLSPYVVPTGTSVWTNIQKASGSTSSQYRAFYTRPALDISPIPPLVVVIPGAHTLVSLSPASEANYGAPAGTLTISNKPQQVSGLSASVGSIGLEAPNSTDPQIFAIDIDVNGAQATPAQLQTLINAITGADGTQSSIVPGLAISTMDPTPGQILTALDSAIASYNLFLDYTTSGFTSGDSLGLDLSNSEDSNLAGYTFTAVAVVPEPMSLSLLVVGATGLLARRHRTRL